MKINALVKARSVAVEMRARAKHPPGVKAGFIFEQAAGEVLAKTGKVPPDTTATLYIYEPIGIDWWTGEGCTASSVVSAIAEAKKAGATALDVRILSEGGDCFDGAGIHEALKRCGLPTTAYNDGLCASAATLVALGCDKVIAAPTSLWMMHRAWSMAGGHESDMIAMGELLSKLDNTIAAVYAEKSGKSAKACLSLMTEQKGGPDGNWMNAEECVAAGFADEIARAGTDAEQEATDTAVADNAVMRLMAQTDLRVSEKSRIAASAAGAPAAATAMGPECCTAGDCATCTADNCDCCMSGSCTCRGDASCVCCVDESAMASNAARIKSAAERAAKTISGASPGGNKPPGKPSGQK